MYRSVLLPCCCMYFIVHPFSFRRQIRVPYLKGGLTHRDRTSPLLCLPCFSPYMLPLPFLINNSVFYRPNSSPGSVSSREVLYAKQPPTLPSLASARYMIRDCPLKWGPAEHLKFLNYKVSIVYRGFDQFVAATGFSKIIKYWRHLFISNVEKMMIWFASVRTLKCCDYVNNLKVKIL